MDYLNFDIFFDHNGEHYKTRVINSPAGQEEVDFSQPFSRQELEDFKSNMVHHQSDSRLSGEEIAKAFGGRLFQAVFYGKMLSCLQRNLDEATRQKKGLRLRLHLKDASGLADLPWEYLYDSAFNRFPALSEKTPIIRYLDLPVSAIQHEPVDPPLRILVMISSPYDYPQLDTEQEWSKLCETFADLEKSGLVKLDRLKQTTLTSLQETLRKKKYHILHFIGHGDFDKETNEGTLILGDDSQCGSQVSGQRLGILLNDEQTLRLVFLNTCESASTSRKNPFAGVAQNLVQQGVPSVIAMQSAMPDDTSIIFSHGFYKALTDGFSVDAATAEARKAIYMQDYEVEWGIPTLFMRSQSGRFFVCPR